MQKPANKRNLRTNTPTKKKGLAEFLKLLTFIVGRSDFIRGNNSSAPGVCIFRVLSQKDR